MVAVDAYGVVYWFLFLSVLLFSFSSAYSFYASGNVNGFCEMTYTIGELGNYHENKCYD